MCHPAAYAAVFIAQAYMSAQAQNEQAEKQNKMFERNAELRQKVYQDQILRIAEQRKRVGEAANVEAEKYADAKLDQKKQLIEARGQIQYIHSTESFRFITSGGSVNLTLDGGKVGIGTEVPGQDLEVGGEISATELFVTSGGDTAKNNISGKFSHGGINSKSLVIGADPNNVGGSKRMQFDVDGDEKMRITNQGRIGIGTQTPDSTLTIHTTTPGENVFNIHADFATNKNRTINLYAPASDSGDDPYIFQTPNSMQFKVDSHPGIKIHTNGTVGIGETTPDSKLDILHSTSTNSNTENIIHLRTDPGAGYVSRGLFIKIGRDANYDNSAAHYDIVGSSGNSGFHVFEVQGDEKLRITKDGRVGIGSDVPNAVLDVYKVGGTIAVFGDGRPGTFERIAIKNNV